MPLDSDILKDNRIAFVATLNREDAPFPGKVALREVGTHTYFLSLERVVEKKPDKWIWSNSRDTALWDMTVRRLQAGVAPILLS